MTINEAVRQLHIAHSLWGVDELSHLMAHSIYAMLIRWIRGQTEEIKAEFVRYCLGKSVLVHYRLW